METLEPILREHPFFGGLEPASMRLVAGCASNVHFDSGAYLCREGDEANAFFVLRQGAIALEVFAPGRGRITIQTLHAGDVLGWAWVFPPYAWRSDARALEPTRAIALNGECLRRKCEDDPALGYELMKRFAHVLDRSLDAARLQLIDLYGHPARR